MGKTPSGQPNGRARPTTIFLRWTTINSILRSNQTLLGICKEGFYYKLLNFLYKLLVLLYISTISCEDARLYIWAKWDLKCKFWRRKTVWAATRRHPPRIRPYKLFYQCEEFSYCLSCFWATKKGHLLIWSTLEPCLYPGASKRCLLGRNKIQGKMVKPL